MTYKWILPSQPPADFLHKLSEYPPVVARLLAERGLDTPEKARDFFNPDYDRGLHDPFLLKDMDIACERVKRAAARREKIVIYSDYDVDGVSAATIVSEFFRQADCPFGIYIPDRAKEGHGLNQSAVESLARSGVDLVITLDCGTTNFKEITWAREHGLDFIVVDHHQVVTEKPPADAFINPHQAGDNYPFKGLCGAGLAFKLYKGLKGNNGKKGEEKWLLDLVALATVADMVPLLDENRVFVKYGLYVLARTRSPGLKKLMASAGIKASYNLETLSTNLDAATLGFGLGPRLNAASRLAHGSLAYDLLTSSDETKLDGIVMVLEENNRKRQQLTDKIIKEVKAIVSKYETPPHFIVEGSADWPVSLAGLAASKVVDCYYRPALLFEKRAGGICKGSLRGVEGFNVIAALESVRDKLIQYGGHPAAAGCSFKIEEAEAIAARLNEYAKSALTPDLLAKKLYLAAEISFNELNWGLMDWLKKFEPYGMSNPKPKFLTKNAEVRNMVSLGQNGEHLKLFLRDPKSSREFPVLFFRHNGLAADLKIGDTVDVVYELGVNEWNGSRAIELKLIDFRLIT